MNYSQFTTPILFIIFNRPDTTRKVFEHIRNIRPKFLYVAADGPRKNILGEEEKCRLSREIINSVDWDCNVQKLYNDKNLGCKIAVSNAISWFFENVEYGIILEDDIIAESNFFYFISELLQYYKNYEKIMHISGSNFLNVNLKATYRFSNYPHVWGWGTWRTAWKLYDRQMKDLPSLLSKNFLSRIFATQSEIDYFTKKFIAVYNNQIDTWDYQWNYTIYKNYGLSITPNINLTSNIGFRNDATHTKIFDDKLAQKKLESFYSILHPDSIEIDKSLDTLLFRQIHNYSFIDKLRLKLRTILSGK